MDTPTAQMKHRPLWLVHEVTILAHWVDEFTMAWSALFLGFVGAMIALDSLTHVVGNNKLLFLLTGIAAAIGIETQGRTLIRRGKMAWDRDARTVAVWWMVGAVPIMLVLFQLAWMFLLEYSYGMTEAQAISAIGLSPQFVTFERAAVLIYLLSLSGFVYYTRPKVELAEKIAAKREEAALAAEDAHLIVATQQKRDAQAWAARQTAAAAFTGRYANDPLAASAARANAYTSATDRAYAQVGQVGMPVASAPSFFRGDDDDDTPPPTSPAPTTGGARGARGLPSGSLGERGRPSYPITRYADSDLASRAAQNVAADVKDFLLSESRRFASGQLTHVPTQQEVLRYLQDCGHGFRGVSDAVKAAIASALTMLADEGITLAWDVTPQAMAS